MGELCQEKWQKKGGWYHRKLSAMGLPTEEWEEEGGYHQVVAWNLPEGTRVVVAFQLLICVWLFMTPWTVAGQAPLSVGQGKNTGVG